MKLYTKTGDDGTTGLFGGSRVPKNNPRVAAYGDVDELNAAIGWAMTAVDDDTAAILAQVQRDLFSLGAELATAEGARPRDRVTDGQVMKLEQWIDAATEEMPPLETFILPGGAPAAAAMHLARTVSRRAERAAVTLSQLETVEHHVIVYLNRLSDLLFALARRANHRAGVSDIPWIGPRNEPK